MLVNVNEGQEGHVTKPMPVAILLYFVFFIFYIIIIFFSFCSLWYTLWHYTTIHNGKNMSQFIS